MKAAQLVPIQLLNLFHLRDLLRSRCITATVQLMLAIEALHFCSRLSNMVPQCWKGQWAQTTVLLIRWRTKYTLHICLPIVGLLVTELCFHVVHRHFYQMYSTAL